MFIVLFITLMCNCIFLILSNPDAQYQKMQSSVMWQRHKLVLFVLSKQIFWCRKFSGYSLFIFHITQSYFPLMVTMSYQSTLKLHHHVLQRPLRVAVIRDGQRVQMSLTPQKWSGRGLLGWVPPIHSPVPMFLPLVKVTKVEKSPNQYMVLLYR